MELNKPDKTLSTKTFTALNKPQRLNHKNDLYEKVQVLTTNIYNRSIVNLPSKTLEINASDLKEMDNILIKYFNSNWNQVRNFFHSINVPNLSKNPSVELFLSYRKKL